MADIYSTSRKAQPKIVQLDAGMALKSFLILAIVALDAAWILLSDFEFAIASSWKVITLVAVLGAGAWIYRVKRPMRQFEVLCAETAFLLAFSAAAAVFSVLITSIGLPLIDDRLMAIDSALGFDWQAYVGFVNGYRWLGQVSSFIYMTTLSQVALTVVALAFLGKLETVQHFVLSVMLGALICIAISAILPAAGALGTIRPPAEFIAMNSPVVDLEYKQAFFDLRDGLGRFISFDEPRGLIAFPSYHATLSALIILAFTRIRMWFWPVLALNLAVILSTPVDGGHHMIDAMGGVAVAFAAWGLAGKVGGTRPGGRGAGR